MRIHQTMLAVLLLLGALALPGCSRSADPADQEKDSSGKQEKSGTTPPGEKTGSTTTGKTQPGRPPTREPVLLPPAGEPGLNLAGSDSAGAGDSSQPPWWLIDRRIAALIGLFIFLGLALHVVHVLTQSRFKREFVELHDAVRMLSQRLLMNDEIEKHGRTGASNDLTQRLNRHRQSLDQLDALIQQVEQRVTANDRDAADTAMAVAIAARTAAQPRINQALRQAETHTGDVDRARAVKIVERYAEVLGTNEARTAPLIQMMRDFAQWLNGRSNLSPELVARIEELRSDVSKFEHWRSNATERLTALKQGSVSDRYSKFRAGDAQLARQFETRAISLTDYVKAYSELIDRHFPAGAESAVSIAPDEHEAELGEITAGVPDYLMDWFDKLSQLQAQGAQAAIDAETAARLNQIHRTARDVLGKFDIQAEEIQIGVTAFDRRLHDASLITQSPQYPANTVVGVQQSGFRKLSTGDVLRRPKVIVAGVGAAI
jgi:hypothetical protein